MGRLTEIIAYINSDHGLDSTSYTHITINDEAKEIRKKSKATLKRNIKNGKINKGCQPSFQGVLF